jgi:hypothetical protein
MTLRHRIKGVGANTSQAMAGNHPAGTAATPMVMPHFTMTYAPNPGYPWGTLTYEDNPPMWAADGALVPSVTPAGMPRVVPAGTASPAHR